MLNRQPAIVKLTFFEWNTEGGRVELQWLMKATHRLGKPCPVPTGNTSRPQLAQQNPTLKINAGDGSLSEFCLIIPNWEFLLWASMLL